MGRRTEQDALAVVLDGNDFRMSEVMRSECFGRDDSMLVFTAALPKADVCTNETEGESKERALRCADRPIRMRRAARLFVSKGWRCGFRSPRGRDE